MKTLAELESDNVELLCKIESLEKQLAERDEKITQLEGTISGHDAEEYRREANGI